MTPLLAKLERFESLATECDLIASREADGSKRALYLRLGAHLSPTSLRHARCNCDRRRRRVTAFNSAP